MIRICGGCNAEVDGPHSAHMCPGVVDQAKAKARLTKPHGFVEQVKIADAASRLLTPGRAYAQFTAGASIAELARMFCVLEEEIEAALRRHMARIARRAREC